MSERKISLEDIRSDVFTNEKYLLSDYDFDILYKYNYIIKDAMLEFGKKLLELAAENATAKIEAEWSGNTGSEYCDYYAVVNKQSILNTIKQLE